GANLVLGARNQVALQTTVDACIKAGGKAICLPTDVTNSEACRELIESAVNTYGAIAGLVNNAGISMYSRFDQVTDLSMFEQIMQVNYLGAVYCTHYALPYLKESQGLLVAISSLCGKTGIPTRSGYVASKHAMQGFFDTLRVELRGTGVAVLVVSPGFVATDIRQHVLAADGHLIDASLSDEQQQAMSIEECVRQILRAMQQRKRELVMTPKGRFGLWLKLIAPELVDRIAASAVQSQKSR
ncbi:SDR family oxidoreductase, partial [Allocoleopsis sp.]|uniref:SDR family oxidoreductase n=1 Tax=Allocoleopsis sp. TaxID=3088169 RepID=UPI002FD79EC1